jgi:filamentous hemagglutinin
MIAYELVVEAGIGAAATVTAGAASALTAARLALIATKLRKLGRAGEKLADLCQPNGHLAKKLEQLFSQVKKGGKVEGGDAPAKATGIFDDVVRAADRDFAPGSLSAAKSWTRSGRLRAYQRDYNLPIRKGYARYIPPESWSPNQALPRGQSGGFIDKFGNEWVQGVSRTPGQLWEWDVQLGRNASKYFRDKARGGTHVNVSWDGEITH